MGLICHTICFAFLLIILSTVSLAIETIAINKTYNGTIQSGSVHSYNFERQAGQTVRLTTMINRTELNLTLPLLISVQQKRSILSWTLPEALTKFSTISFPEVSRTLCSDSANESSNITIWALTSSTQTISYKLEVNLVSNFELSPMEGMDFTSVNISGGSPYYFLISFQENSTSDVMRISLSSPDDSCVMASLQPAECPIDDLLSTIEYRGVYLTFGKTADVIFDRKENVSPNHDKRYLVLISAPFTRCNSSASANYYQMEQCLPSKQIDIRVTLQLAKWEYWRPVVILLVLLLLPFFILIPLFFFEMLVVLRFRFLERHYPLIFYTPTLDRIIQPDQANLDEAGQGLESSLLVQETLSLSVRGIEGMTKKEMKTRYNIEDFKLHDLTRKEDRYLSKKYSLYLTSVITITVFYALPALQVAIFRAVLYSNGDNDLCYFNFKCAHTLGHVVSFNNIWSNIAFLVLGVVFMLLTALKHILRNIKYIWRERETRHDYRKRGITPYYGLYYAMGLALISEGLMSSIYHTCPSGINFQFDTTFMFVISILSILKLYQNRHPDVSVSASTAFILLGTLIILTAFGLLADKPEYLLVRSVYALMVIGITFFICINIYFFSHPLLFFSSAYDTIKSRSLAMYGQSIRNWVWPPVNKPRILHISIVCLVNTISLICLYVFGWDAATGLLIFIISNQLTYLAYYWFMKLVRKELCNRPVVAVFSIFLTLTSGAFFLPALYFFFSSVTNWQHSPSGSRVLNRECIFLGFFDDHDIWHVLSAFGLFFNFLSIIMIDDNISEIPKNKIHVF